MLLARRIGALVLVALAVGVWFGMAPNDTQNAIDAARGSQTLNAASAESAPQQAVVNGWATVDMLEVVAARESDERPAALLLLAVVGLGLAVATAPNARGGRLESNVTASKGVEPVPQQVPATAV